MSKDKGNLYCNCRKPATWIRRTQFSGNFPFCTDHAKEKKDFGESDSSYFFWEELSLDKIAPNHPIFVRGYEGSLQELVAAIHGMRYDKVEEFYQHVVEELRRQAESDRTKGRHKLAFLLEESVGKAEQQQKQFARIYALCRFYLKEE